MKFTDQSFYSWALLFIKHKMFYSFLDKNTFIQLFIHFTIIEEPMFTKELAWAHQVVHVKHVSYEMQISNANDDSF